MQSLEEATVNVRLQPSNAVLAVRIEEASVPLEPVLAGTVVPVKVLLDTEDGKALPYETAVAGLKLFVMAPGCSSKESQVRSLAFSFSSVQLHACLNIVEVF